MVGAETVATTRRCRLVERRGISRVVVVQGALELTAEPGDAGLEAFGEQIAGADPRAQLEPLHEVGGCPHGPVAHVNG